MTRIILIIGIAAANIILISCSSEKTTTLQEETVKVKTARVEERAITIPIRSVGKVYAKKEIKLGFKTGGIIKEILVDEGQKVQKGQVLAILNLSEIEAILNQSKLGYEKAERDYHRAENLFNDSVVTLEQLENAKTALEYAQSGYEIAKFNFKYSQITAPNDGKILKRLAEQNELINSGYPVFIFGSSDDDWVVRANISDVDIFKIQQNDKATLTFDSYTGESFSAYVTEIGTSADPYTGTYEIELTITENELRLASGLFARFQIFPDATRSFDIIPLNALVEANEKEGFVYHVNSKNEVNREKVNIYNIRDEYLLVESDLNAGDQVITEGSTYINSNSKIEVIDDFGTELAKN